MADSKEPYGPKSEVRYADPGYQADGKARYPVDTEAHCRAALAYIAKGEDKDKYSPSDYAKVKSAIDEAAEKFGIKVDDGDESKSSPLPGAAHEGTPDGEERSTSEDAAQPGTSSGTERKNTRELPDWLRSKPATDDVSERAATVATKQELETQLEEAEAVIRGLVGDDETRAAELSDEDTAIFDETVESITALRGKIEAIDKRVARVAELAKAGSAERGAKFGAPAVHTKSEDIYNLDAIRAASYNGEDFRTRVADNAKRAVDAAKMPGVRGREDAQAVAMDLLENVDTEDKDLAKRFVATGSEVYERAFGKAVRYGSLDMCTMEERQALTRAQALGTDASGGFAVPFQLDPTVILTNAGATNPIREMARVERIVGKQWQGVTSTGVTVSRGAEGAVAPDNSFTLGQATLSTNRVQGFVPFNIEIDLAWNALRTEITRLLVDGKAREEDSFITGDGTGTNAGGVVGTFVSAGGSVVTAGGTASFSPNDIYALQTALAPRWEPNAQWLVHKGIANKARQFDTAGGAQLLARLGDSKFYELLGYPVKYASAMPSVLTTGSNILAYGDFEQFLIVDRIGMTVELIPHLFDASTQRPVGMRGVYAVWMNNSKILTTNAFQVLQTG